MAESLRHVFAMADATLFLLSPANCSGKRAAILSRPDASFPLAEQFRARGAPIGEVFAFLSGLYFRGKLVYARRFGSVEADLPASLVITSNRGLVSPDAVIGPADLVSFTSVPIDLRETRYTAPMRESLLRLTTILSHDHRVVLLGSIATFKYVEILIDHLGERLLVPERFLGMGDMQRGALMLRSAEAGEELQYAGAEAAILSRARSLRQKSTPG
ncbi:hypothetical protein BH23GEM6_BH23GEM6_19130 [soil metagenome]